MTNKEYRHYRNTSLLHPSILNTLSKEEYEDFCIKEETDYFFYNLSVIISVISIIIDGIAIYNSLLMILLRR